MGARIVLNRAQLAELLESPQGETGQYLVQASQRVLNQARARCPVDTGNLRGSLTYEVSREGNGELRARVGTNVPYAIFVHEGTRYMAPRPFLREAIQSVQF